MTLMMASVADAAEAELALNGGADIIDFTDPRLGKLGLSPIETIEAGAGVVQGQRPISAAIGPPPYEPHIFEARALALAEAGVGAIRLAADAAMLGALAPSLRKVAPRVDLYGSLLPPEESDFGLVPRLAEIGFKALFLVGAEAPGDRIFDRYGAPRLDAFCVLCRRRGIEPAFAGALQAPDVPRLLLLGPWALSFRGVLCGRGRREAPLDPYRVALIRDLIPRDRAPPPWAPWMRGEEQSRETPSPGPSPRSLRVKPGEGEGVRARGDSTEAQEVLLGAESNASSDAVFVRDFVIAADVGAYTHEHGPAQRVRFNVEARVRREARADDMRAVFSYDVILDAIRLVVGRRHVDFLETLAEEVADMVLDQPLVAAVKVRVEKLDLMDGAVGVEIRRSAERG